MHSRPLLVVVALLVALGVGAWWIAERSPGKLEAPQFEAPTLVKSEAPSPGQLQVPEPVQKETRLTEESVLEPRANKTTAGGVTPDVIESAAVEASAMSAGETSAEERRLLEDKIKRYLDNQRVVSKQE